MNEYANFITWILTYNKFESLEQNLWLQSVHKILHLPAGSRLLGWILIFQHQGNKILMLFVLYVSIFWNVVEKKSAVSCFAARSRM